MDDSDADKDYLPSETSSDTDNEFVSQNFSSQLKVRSCSNKRKVNQLEEQEIGQIHLLEKDLYLSDDEESNTGSILNEEDVSNSDNVSNRPIKRRKLKNKTAIKQSGKKRVRHSEQWLCNIRKKISVW